MIISPLRLCSHVNIISGNIYLALDGCSENPDSDFHDAVPGYYKRNQNMAQIICCSMDGTSCSRKTDDGKCYSGHGKDSKVTWHTARNFCKNIGKRLCTSQEELNQCCGSGCDYDNVLAWVDVLEPGR